MTKSNKNNNNDYSPKTDLEFSEKDVFRIYSMVDMEQGFGLKYAITMFRFHREFFANQAQCSVDDQDKE